MRWLFILLLSITPSLSLAKLSCQIVLQSLDGITDVKPLAFSLDRIEQLAELRRERLEMTLEEVESSRWRERVANLKVEISRALVDESFLTTARELNEVIIVRSMNPAAYMHLERSVSTKSMNIKLNTARSGLIAGLVPEMQVLANPRISSAKVREFQEQLDQLLSSGDIQLVTYQSESGVVVIREGQQIWATEILPGDVPVRVLADRRGRLITGDADILTVARKGQVDQEILQDPERGYYTRPDLRTMNHVNQQFHRLDTRTAVRNLVHHGPESAYSGSQGISYNLVVYRPDGRMQIVKEGPAGAPHLHFDRLMEELRAQGYQAQRNPAW